MRFEAGGAFIVGLCLSACAVVGPLADPSMSGARSAACARVNGAIPQVGGDPVGNTGEAVGAPPVYERQCFRILVEATGQGRSEWGGGLIEPGQALVAVHLPGEGCSGTFTHLTVSGGAQSAGVMELATWDVHARPGHSRTVRWHEGFADRTFALADVGSALMNPAGARITMREGAFDPRQLCFKSY